LTNGFAPFLRVRVSWLYVHLKEWKLVIASVAYKEPVLVMTLMVGFWLVGLLGAFFVFIESR